jgi:membrane fusion protein (multidrug efflux system)
MLVPSTTPWVTANFKETQLGQMRPGQPAKLVVDSYPNLDLHGEVESLSSATGARFALLPPDNATGNFTKIIQRLPVRIKITDLPAGVDLRPGLSVDVTVDTRK